MVKNDYRDKILKRGLKEREYSYCKTVKNALNYQVDTTESNKKRESFQRNGADWRVANIIQPVITSANSRQPKTALEIKSILFLTVKNSPNYRREFNLY